MTAANGATFVGTDTTTGEDWRSAYGSDGYDIAQDTGDTNPSLPSYAQVTLSGQSNWTWPSGTAGLQPGLDAAVRRRVRGYRRGPGQPDGDFMCTTRHWG